LEKIMFACCTISAAFGTASQVKSEGGALRWRRARSDPTIKEKTGFGAIHHVLLSGFRSFCTLRGAFPDIPSM
jgi:hypothetical protein